MVNVLNAKCFKNVQKRLKNRLKQSNNCVLNLFLEIKKAA